MKSQESGIYISKNTRVTIQVGVILSVIVGVFSLGAFASDKSAAITANAKGIVEVKNDHRDDVKELRSKTDKNDERIDDLSHVVTSVDVNIKSINQTLAEIKQEIRSIK